MSDPGITIFILALITLFGLVGLVVLFLLSWHSGAESKPAVQMASGRRRESAAERKIAGYSDAKLYNELFRVSKWFSHLERASASARNAAIRRGRAEEYAAYNHFLLNEKVKRELAPDLREIPEFLEREDELWEWAIDFARTSSPKSHKAIVAEIKEALAPERGKESLAEEAEPEGSGLPPQPVIATPGVIRKAGDVIEQFAIAPEEYQVLHLSYQQALGFGGENVNWNDDIDDFARSIKALSEDEILAGQTNFEQAVINRIIVSRS